MKHICYIAVLISAFFLSCQHKKSNHVNPETFSVLVNGEKIEMVLIEGNSFKSEHDFICNNDSKFVDTFYIGKYEVTQKVWKAIMGEDNNPSYNRGCDNCPVENVSWKDAQEFISKLNLLVGKQFRLPTKTEWEYAAKGGVINEECKYSGSNNIDEVAWYINNYQLDSWGDKGTTHPVGLKKSNILGIYDMSGNVWEWCYDLYTEEYMQNGKIIHEGWPYKGTHLYFRRVIKGGSWGGTAEGCSVAYTDFDVENYEDEYGGFRLVLDYDKNNK